MNSDYGQDKTATGRVTVYVHLLYTVRRYDEGRRTIKSNTEVGDRSERWVSIRTEAKLGHLFVCLFVCLTSGVHLWWCVQVQMEVYFTTKTEPSERRPYSPWYSAQPYPRTISTFESSPSSRLWTRIKTYLNTPEGSMSACGMLAMRAAAFVCVHMSKLLKEHTSKASSKRNARIFQTSFVSMRSN